MRFGLLLFGGVPGQSLDQALRNTLEKAEAAQEAAQLVAEAAREAAQPVAEAARSFPEWHPD